MMKASGNRIASSSQMYGVCVGAGAAAAAAALPAQGAASRHDSDGRTWRGLGIIGVVPLDGRAGATSAMAAYPSRRGAGRSAAA